VGLKLKKFKRTRVNNIDEVFRIVKLYNGLTDIYISVYDMFYGIDKIVFDFDSPNLQDAYVDACMLVDALKSDNVRYAIVFSGKKGFHVYVLFNYWKPPNKDTAIVVNRSIYYYYLETANYTTMDYRLVGDVSRLIRIPNTKHSESKRYAIPLDPDVCNKYDISDIICMSREPKPLILSSGDLRDPREYVNIHSAMSETMLYSSKPLDIRGHSIPLSRKQVLDLLRDLVRPCIIKVLEVDPEPPHDIRTYFVTELVWLGYSIDEIVDIIRALSWEDFNEKITRYHVTKIYEKVVRERRLYPPTCKTLRDKGYCLRDKCPTGEWYYWWGLI